MRLYLVQHGAALPKEVDPERHLTDAGAADVKKVADFLRPLKLSVAAIWHSGKPRAKQTAEILARAISSQQGVVEREGLAPGDPVGPVRKLIEQSQEDLLIAGHLPLLSKLAALLVTGDKAAEVTTFRYGGVVCLDRSEAGHWTIAWIILPDLLRP